MGQDGEITSVTSFHLFKLVTSGERMEVTELENEADE